MDKYRLISPSIFSSVLLCLSKSCFTVKIILRRIGSKGTALYLRIRLRHTSTSTVFEHLYYCSHSGEWCFSIMPLYASGYTKVSSVLKDWTSMACCKLQLTFRQIKMKSNRACFLSSTHLHNAPPRIWQICGWYSSLQCVALGWFNLIYLFICCTSYRMDVKTNSMKAWNAIASNV